MMGEKVFKERARKPSCDGYEKQGVLNQKEADEYMKRLEARHKKEIRDNGW